MSIVTMMIGLPGSGKTTFAKDLEYDETEYLSSDEIREKEFGDISNMSNNAKVFALIHERMINALEEGRDVILDMTNLKKKYRKTYINTAKEYGARVVAIYMDIDFETALKRNNLRDRKVPKDVIEKMASEMEAPTEEEGFDEICVIDENNDVVFIL